MKRKAISPLIATILLIVVAVALIAIVVAWGRNFTSTSLDDATGAIDVTCMGTAIHIRNCSVSADGNISFLVENIGTKQISSADDFIIHVTNQDTGITTLNEKLSDHDSELGSDGLAPGQMHSVSMTGIAAVEDGKNHEVKVISSICPSDAISTVKNCK